MKLDFCIPVGTNKCRSEKRSGVNRSIRSNLEAKQGAKWAYFVQKMPSWIYEQLIIIGQTIVKMEHWASDF